MSSSATIYAGVFLVVVVLIAASYKAPSGSTSNLVPGSVASAASVDGQGYELSSMDQSVAIKAAADIAGSADLPVAANVENLSVSMEVERSMPSGDDDTSAEKPRVITSEGADRGVRQYKVKRGDTVTSVAQAHDVSANTVRWANDLKGNSLKSGRTLAILPVTGVQHTVKSGDSVESVARKYKAGADRITSYNNLELSSSKLKAGTKIIIPGGVLPKNERPGYSAESSSPSSYSAPNDLIQSSGSGFGGKSWNISNGTKMGPGNRYAFGNCTAYAFDRRAELGKPIGGLWGHAATWAAAAQSEGFKVNNTPAVGAIMQNGGGFGHVAIVEKVHSNGDVEVSEMNAYVSGGGFNIVSGRKIPASSAKSYAYIH